MSMSVTRQHFFSIHLIPFSSSCKSDLLLFPIGEGEKKKNPINSMHTSKKWDQKIPGS